MCVHAHGIAYQVHGVHHQREQDEPGTHTAVIVLPTHIHTDTHIRTHNETEEEREQREERKRERQRDRESQREREGVYPRCSLTAMLPTSLQRVPPNPWMWSRVCVCVCVCVCVAAASNLGRVVRVVRWS